MLKSKLNMKMRDLYNKSEKFNEYSDALPNTVTTQTSATLSNATSDRHSMKHVEFIGGLMPLGDVYRSAINKLERAITSDSSVSRRSKCYTREHCIAESGAQKRQSDAARLTFLPDVIATCCN